LVVAGLDLARRRDYSALVLLDAEPYRLTVTAAARLYREVLEEPIPTDLARLLGRLRERMEKHPARV
jgi:hypothetical protein